MSSVDRITAARRWAAPIALIAAVAAAWPPMSRAERAPGAGGSFTVEQAARGKAVYARRCAACHGPDLAAEDPSIPALTGQSFRLAWQGHSLLERYTAIRDGMPPGRPQLLSEQEGADVVAYILQGNGYAAGAADLSSDPKVLGRILVEAPPGAVPAR